MDYEGAKRRLQVKQYISEISLMIFGCLFMAFGTSFFLLPNQLSSGGFAGIATITYYLFHFPLGIVMFLLNIPLFILGYIRIGKGFVAKSILGTLVLSTFIDIFDQFPELTKDKFLACLYGGITIGMGTAMVLKAHSSTGGTDLLSYLIKSFRPQARQGSVIVAVDIIIVSLNVVFFQNIEVGLYSAVAIYLMGKMIDIVFEGIYFTKVLFIISDHYEEIAKLVGEKVERGSTGILAKGMYTRQEKMMLLCVGSRNEIALIKEIAKSIDRKAFMIVFNAREAVGKGFRK